MERAPTGFIELELREVGIVGELDAGAIEILERGRERAVLRLVQHEQLERAVDQRALARGGRWRLGEPVDVAELEREGAVLERGERARRQSLRQTYSHAPEGSQGEGQPPRTRTPAEIVRRRVGQGAKVVVVVSTARLWGMMVRRNAARFVLGS